MAGQEPQDPSSLAIADAASSSFECQWCASTWSASRFGNVSSVPPSPATMSSMHCSRRLRARVAEKLPRMRQRSRDLTLPKEAKSRSTRSSVVGGRETTISTGANPV